jgi:hypothetical protein
MKTKQTKQLHAVLKAELERAEMPPPLTCAELNVLGCSDPNCAHDDHSMLYLHQRCCEDAGSWASFDKHTGVLTLECRECKKPFAKILVAAHRNVGRIDREWHRIKRGSAS